MKYLHIATGKHMDAAMTGGPRFYINTAPGVMEPKHGVNEAHGSYLQRDLVVELRDELDEWLRANPTPEELQEAHDRQVRAQALRDAAEWLRDDMDEPWGLRAANRLDLRADAEERGGKQG